MKEFYISTHYPAWHTAPESIRGLAVAGRFAPIFCRKDSLTGVYTHCAIYRICAETGRRGRNDRRITCNTRTFRIWVSISGTYQKPLDGLSPHEDSPRSSSPSPSGGWSMHRMSMTDECFLLSIINISHFVSSTYCLVFLDARFL